MRIGVILAGSQAEKYPLLYDSAKQYAKGCEVVSFSGEDDAEFSYIEVSLAAGFLLAGGAVDFIITGCSSGQGMMLACNSIPGVLCGYAPTPQDAYLFVQINNGNVVSLPLGEDYTYSGEENCRRTIEKMFSEPFGGGYPKSEADRKLRDTALLKEIRVRSQTDFISFVSSLDDELIRKVLSKRNLAEYIIGSSSDKNIVEWIKHHI